ncbi:MAG: hypothetical protein ISR78_04160 [Spirochaetia bacterium]|nr:hypothetical protein [Spirochaetia bacterium]
MKKILVYVAIFAMSISLLSASGNKENPPEVSLNGENAVADAITSASFDNISLEWKVSETGDEIEFILQAKTTGWIAVGFDPSQIMKDAQFVIGYVNSGDAVIRDDFGNSSFSHAPDTGLGGTDDVRLISGLEEDGWTQLIFALPVNSGDDKDVPLTLGEKHNILLAFGPDNKDDFRTKHSFRTSFEGVF